MRAQRQSTAWGKPGEAAGPGRPPNADVYQMLAYCTTYRLSRGHLVYAAGGPMSGSYQLTGSGIRVDVHPVDLSVPIAEIRQRIQDLGTAVAARPDSRVDPLRLIDATHRTAVY
ncbi:hypothetical protein O7623_09655 [Solwaraspora sp. WMMD791]|uniref:hypothetical protein n=1 Tax=Solwaraspora sp. WMMD791 TaxID=3016086 RepID=UPI00249C804D|nr:hypothetical protein [Solwaraspora sp. WMMD791]WFE29426.1 hypothetical protein O7623_09655 [Solwaraspora sp. WMMD791]